MKGKRIFVAVVGGRQCSQEEAKLAEAVGVELAKRGVILVCGGLGGVWGGRCLFRGEAPRPGSSVPRSMGGSGVRVAPHIPAPVRSSEHVRRSLPVRLPVVRRHAQDRGRPPDEGGPYGKR